MWLAGFSLLLVLFGTIYLFLQKRNEDNRWKLIDTMEFPQEFEQIQCKAFHPYNFLDTKEKQTLTRKILYFMEYKNFHPIGGFEITNEIKLLISAQACLLVLNLEGGVYPTLKNLFIAASTFVDKNNYVDFSTALPRHVPTLGESWTQGPVVLSWNSAKNGLKNWNDGQNVVLHEFAHQLDALDGHMDGTPELSGEKSYRKWKIFMGKEFSKLRSSVEKRRHHDIDSYGATNEAEFFAVTVEYFFEKTPVFKKKHPELFELFHSFFKIDPCRWN